MLDFTKLKLRAILTETLPYELPILFSNEFLFTSELTLDNLSPASKRLFVNSNYRRALKADAFTIPMNFRIRKGERDFNTMGLIHPLQQVNMAHFLDDYAATILEQSKNSSVALRAPAEIVPFLSKKSSDELSQNFSDFPEDGPANGLEGVAYAASYFTIRKYNLLDKFYNSNELLRLEARFPLMRTIDVAKCFFNIYTHSICWAVKDKGFSKEHASKYSFEGRFDALMQKSNYNETNGILVGPEISRIFAEIIFQKIDQNISDLMFSRHGIKLDEDYTFRRYVDDFFLFSRDEDNLENLTRAVHECLEDYKLYPNAAKQKDQTRPFITNVTIAKKGIGESAVELEELCATDLCENPELASDKFEEKVRARILQERSKYLREALEAIRITIGKTETNFNEVSGPIYTSTLKAIDAISEKVRDDVSKRHSADITIRLRGVLRILFYSLASDFRTTPIYKCYDLISRALKICKKLDDVDAQVIKALIIFELTQLVETFSKDERVDEISVELCNLFIIAGLVDRELFLQQETVKIFIQSATNCDDFSYFSFVGLLFLLGDNATEYADIKLQVTSSVKNRITSNKNLLGKNAEIYFLFSDFVACKFIPRRVRLNLINEIVDAPNIQDIDLDAVSPHFSFVDWTGEKASYILKRKRLQPVYFSW